MVAAGAGRPWLRGHERNERAPGGSVTACPRALFPFSAGFSAGGGAGVSLGPGWVGSVLASSAFFPREGLRDIFDAHVKIKRREFENESLLEDDLKRMKADDRRAVEPRI